jgi:hypothetical protein
MPATDFDVDLIKFTREKYGQALIAADAKNFNLAVKLYDEVILLTQEFADLMDDEGVDSVKILRDLNYQRGLMVEMKETFAMVDNDTKNVWPLRDAEGKPFSDRKPVKHKPQPQLEPVVFGQDSAHVFGWFMLGLVIAVFTLIV